MDRFIDNKKNIKKQKKNYLKSNIERYIENQDPKGHSDY